MEKVEEKDKENGETTLFIIPKMEKHPYSSFVKWRNNIIHHSSAASDVYKRQVRDHVLLV